MLALSSPAEVMMFIPRSTLIEEVETMVEHKPHATAHEREATARDIVLFGSMHETYAGTVRFVGPSGHKREMLQEDAARIVRAAKARIEAADDGEDSEPVVEWFRDHIRERVDAIARGR